MLQSPTQPLDDFDALAADQQEDEGLRAFLDTPHELQVRAVPLASPSKKNGRESRQSLSRPYDGPFEVQRINDKTVTIVHNDRQDTVSIDRVKPAFVDRPTDSDNDRAAVRPGRVVTPEADGPRLLLPEPPSAPQRSVSAPAPPPDDSGQSAGGEEPALRTSLAPGTPPSASSVSPATPTLRPALRNRTPCGREVKLPAKYRHVTFLVVPDSAVSGEGAMQRARSAATAAGAADGKAQAPGRPARAVASAATHRPSCRQRRSCVSRRSAGCHYFV